MTATPHSISDAVPNVDGERQSFVVALFSTVGAAYLFFFGIPALLRQDYLLGVLLGLSGLAAIINYLVFLKIRNYRTASAVVVAITAIFSIYLLITGGVEGTGPLWCYVAIPMILFLYGPRTGTMVLALYCIVLALLLFIPGNSFQTADYSFAFKSRFLTVFLAVSIMSFVHEYSRYKAHESMEVLRSSVEHEALTDPLTGLPNRRAMYRRLHAEDNLARRRNKPYSLLLADLDNFKSFNDTYGHLAGDQILERTAQILVSSLRRSDLSARWGGEEFLILLPDTTLDGAVKVAEKVRRLISEGTIDHEGDLIGTTISIGVHQAELSGDIDRVLNICDRHLYRTKDQGRDRIAYEDESGT